ncbi:MAG: DUF2203 domain-containing protein [Candidatus Aenigmarchaeota archaeon]|nr:DUF2203 domain-containing protein [Candidatus Aenigmarchaeota archaeon]
MEQRIFTIDEAEQCLPRVKEIFDKIFEINTRVKAATSDINSLLEIWGKDVSESSHRDHKLYIERLKKRDELVDRIKHLVDEIHELGAFVKGVDDGLVDFLFDKGGEIVCLCWKYGDKKLGYWHGVSDGYVGRRPLNELLGLSGNQIRGV